MKKRDLVKFILIEILSVLLFSLSYRICIRILVSNIVIIDTVSLIISLLFEYICLTKIVYVKYRRKKYDLLKFCIASIIGIFLIKYLSYAILVGKLSFHILISKVISLILLLFYNYVIKNYIFNEFEIRNWKKPFIEINKYWEKFINYKYVKLIFKFLPNNMWLFIYLIVSVYFGVRFFNMFDDIILYNQANASGNIGSFVNTAHTISFNNIEDLKGNPNKICIVFATYSRKNDSNLTFNLYNNNELIFTKKINTNILHDGKKYCFNTPEMKKEKINEYRLDIVSSNADDKNNVTILLDAETKKEVLSLRRNHSLTSLKYVIMGLFVLTFLLICYFINKNGDKITPEKMLLIFMVYIVSELFIFPPLQVPDEPYHFVQAYSLSQNWSSVNAKKSINVPSNIKCINYSYVVNYNKVLEANDIAKCLKNSEKNVERKELFGAKVGKTSTILGYLSSALTLKFVDTFSNSSLLIFYLSRLGTFIVSFVILFFAIKITPKYKNIMLLIGVLPMFIQQMNSFSYDSILNSIVMLYYAFILRKISSDKIISFKDVIIPIISLVIMYTLKMVYIFLFVLLFFIPVEKFKTLKRKIIYIFIIAAFVFFSVYLIQNVLFVSEGILNTTTNKQLQYILHNPLYLFTIAINTLKTRTWFYFQGIVGYFGWWAFSLNNLDICLWFVMFVLLCFNEENILFKKISKKLNYKKIVLLIMILLMIAAVFASMYLCWSDYKLNYVEGVQGRYFIPILFSIALLIIPKKVRIKKITNKSIYMYCNILLLQYVLYLIIFFY